MLSESESVYDEERYDSIAKLKVRCILPIALIVSSIIRNLLDVNSCSVFTECFQTSFYTFSLPIRLGMYLANVGDPKKHKAAETIALRIGHIFQVSWTDDFLSYP